MRHHMFKVLPLAVTGQVRQAVFAYRPDAHHFRSNNCRTSPYYLFDLTAMACFVAGGSLVSTA
jgi:hypothetical protein